MSDNKICNNNGPCLETEELERLNNQRNGGGISLLEQQIPMREGNGHDYLNNQSNGDTLLAAVVDDADSETQCGWGRCSPSYVKMFASKQSFLAVFCLAWVLQGMYHTYFVSSITTIEKLFQIQSKVTAVILSATEIGQISSALLFTYYGGQGHRPKWIAYGLILFGISTFTCSLPHFIYGSDLLNANDLSGIIKEPNICRGPNYTSIFTPSTFANATTMPPFTIPEFNSDILQTCEDDEDISPQHKIQPAVTNIVLTIFFISLLGIGMGQTAAYTLAIPFIDDNVASKESPLYFAITIGVRILGPAFGFILGSLCTSVYADLSVDPKIDASDPRWVGAWWLGLVIIAGLLILSSIAMFGFPKRLPNSNKLQQQRNRRLQQQADKKNPSIKDFPSSVKRLLKNDILMFKTASSVLHLLPIAGLYTFLPKYLESQFRLPTPSANMISGVGGILVMGLGIVVSAIFILKFQPNPRFVAGWIAFTAVIYAFGMGILMLIGCSSTDLAGFNQSTGRFDDLDTSCNQTICNCNKEKFLPICGEDGKTYLSPCHAGCQNYTKKDGKIIEYSDCLCLSEANFTNFDEDFIYGKAKIGYCDLECPNLNIYITLFSVFVFIHSTSEVGSMLLTLRCVNPMDKAMALGLIQFAIGLFGNVPCPLIYATVVDYACLIWKTACGERGACVLYDTDTFRILYHGTTGALLLCAFLVDLIVWFKAGSIKFDNADEKEVSEEELADIERKINGEGD